MDLRSTEIGRPLVLLICGTLVYYHCEYRNSSVVSLASDVFIVLLCSLAILGMLFRQMNISVPVDPLEWQISQDTANGIVACLANTVGAAESVLRVAAAGHDKRLFVKVIIILYLLSALGRLASGATVAYAGILTFYVCHHPCSWRDKNSFYSQGLCLFCLYIFVQTSRPSDASAPQLLKRRDSLSSAPDNVQS